MRWHDGPCLGAGCIFAPPQAGDRLGLSVERNARLAVECVCAAASNALLVSGEGEVRQRYLYGVRMRFVVDILPDLLGWAR